MSGRETNNLQTRMTKHVKGVQWKGQQYKYVRGKENVPVRKKMNEDRSNDAVKKLAAPSNKLNTKVHQTTLPRKGTHMKLKA